MSMIQLLVLMVLAALSFKAGIKLARWIGENWFAKELFRGTFVRHYGWFVVAILFSFSYTAIFILFFWTLGFRGDSLSQYANIWAFGSFLLGAVTAIPIIRKSYKKAKETR